MTDREEAVYIAKLAEQAERYAGTAAGGSQELKHATPGISIIKQALASSTTLSQPRTCSVLPTATGAGMMRWWKR